MEEQYLTISLRQIIEMLIRNKNLIFLIVGLFFVISIIYNFFIFTEVYEAKSIIQVNQENSINYNNPDDINSILDKVTLYSYTTVEEYKEYILSPEVLLAVIDELNINIKLEELEKKISLANAKGSNLITIIVKDSNAELAVKIANSLGGKISNFINNLQEIKLLKSTKILESQLIIEKRKLDSALEELKKMISESKDSSAIQKEIDINLNVLNTYKSDYEVLDNTYVDNEFSIKENIKRTKSLIISYEKILGSIDKTFTLYKNILNDNYLFELAKRGENDLSNLMKLKFEDEEINPVFISTLQKITEKKINLLEYEESLIILRNKYNYDKRVLINNIEKHQTKIDKLKVALAEKEIMERLIHRKVAIAESTYDAFSDKLEHMRVATAAKISENNVVLVSKAILPNYPVSPNKKLNLAIGLILGLMIGVFAAFFKEYWANSKPE